MKMTLEIETTDLAQLRAAQEAIATHLRILGVPPTQRDVVSAIEAMWPEVEARRVLYFAAAGWEAEEEFTLEDLTTTMGLNLESIKAYHRNLARALKARGIDIEDVMPSRRLAGQRHYHLPPEVHAVARDLPLHPQAA